MSTRKPSASSQTIASTRLRSAASPVIDATNVQRDARKPLLALAKDNDVLLLRSSSTFPKACSRSVCASARTATFRPHVIHNQANHLRRSIRDLQKEGFRYVFILRSQEDVDAVTIERQRLWTDRRDEHGPFDMVGDIHGCHDELIALLGVLGYDETNEPTSTPTDGAQSSSAISSTGGPRLRAVLRTVMAMVRAGSATLCPRQPRREAHAGISGSPGDGQSWLR